MTTIWCHGSLLALHQLYKYFYLLLLTTDHHYHMVVRRKNKNTALLTIGNKRNKGIRQESTKYKSESRKEEGLRKKPFDCIMALKSKLNILFLNTSREGEITISLGKTFQYLVILMKKQLLNFWFLTNLKLLCIWSEFWRKLYEWDLKLKWSLKFISERPLINYSIN